VPKSSISSDGTPAAASRSAQKPSEAAGTERFSILIWFEPRRPMTPAWRKGNVVSSVEMSRRRFP